MSSRHHGTAMTSQIIPKQTRSGLRHFSAVRRPFQRGAAAALIAVAEPAFRADWIIGASRAQNSARRRSFGIRQEGDRRACEGNRTSGEDELEKFLERASPTLSVDAYR